MEGESEGKVGQGRGEVGRGRLRSGPEEREGGGGGEVGWRRGWEGGKWAGGEGREEGEMG